MSNDSVNTFNVSLFFPKSSTSTVTNKTGTWSFMRPSYLEKTAPCSVHCPCGQDIPRIEMLVSRGQIAAAWNTILAENPLPGTCGRVCFHPCEKACNRGQFDEAVSINAIERYLDDAAWAASIAPAAARGSAKGKRIAIVGSGPAGLAASYFLSMLGYECEIFEAAEEPGGILRYGIPAYRLPNEVLDREIARIRALGVMIHCARAVDSAFLEGAKHTYDAVFLSCGNGASMKLGVPGEELALDGLAFLRSAKQGEGAARTMSVKPHGSAIVVGGGNTAIDVARSLRRMGVSPTIVYRRRREDMPAFEHEVARALEEGVRMVELRAPLALARVDGGIELKVQKMRPAGVGADGRMRVVPDGDATELIFADALYSAIGATHAESWMVPPDDGRVVRLSHAAAFWDAPVGIPLLYGGDPVNENESVADAIASGKQAAIALDVFFQKGAGAVKAELARCAVGDGTSLSMEIYLGGPRANRSARVVSFKDIPTDYFSPSEKKRGASLPPERAIASFEEIESSLGAAEAAMQAERCFNCGICNDCDNCRTYCPELAITALRAGRRDDWSTEAGPARAINSDYCKGCGICAAECPRCAMIIEEQQS